MYQAQRDQQRRRNENASNLSIIGTEGTLLTGSAKRKRTLRLEERKLQEHQKPKSHKLLRQISDESSDEESETTKECLQNEKTKGDEDNKTMDILEQRKKEVFSF